MDVVDHSFVYYVLSIVTSGDLRKGEKDMDDFMKLFLALDYKSRCEAEEAELDADYLDELDFDHEGEDWNMAEMPEDW